MSFDQHPGLSPLNEPNKATRPSARNPIRIFGVSLLMLLFIAGSLAVIFVVRSAGLSPLGALGPVLHMETPDGGRAYMLTGQWRTYTLTTGRHVTNTSVRSDLYVDLWAFSARDAKPIWRKRLQTEPGGAMYSRQILGGDGNTIWLLFQGKLLGMAADTGEVTVPFGTIEAKNPELKGMLPTEERYYRFDATGLAIKAADGRDWRIDGTGFVATPVAAAAQLEEKPGVFVPAFYTPQATYLFQDRGLTIPGHWLGLLTDAEAKNFAEQRTPGGLDRETRRRLWRARVLENQEVYGNFPQCQDFEPLPDAPEVLDGGLLLEFHSGQNTPPMWLRDPDSVLLLHRERLGNAGRLRLARIKGPEGTVLWEAVLPMSVLQSVIQGKESIILFGTEWPEPDPTELSDPSHDAPLRLIAVDTATGAVHVHDHAAVDSHPEAVPVDIGL